MKSARGPGTKTREVHARKAQEVQADRRHQNHSQPWIATHRELFHPLRLALTGRESGPEMAGVLKRMGKERAVRRLEAAAKR